MKKCPKFSNGGTPKNAAETSASKLTPAQWAAKNEGMGYVRVKDVKHPTPYNVYRDPKKQYQTVVNDEVVDLPFITYSVPGQQVVVDPNHKPLQMGPNMNYNPNTGTYINPVTGKTIEPIIEQYKDGGNVPKKKRDPIYVDSVNDPKYKAYQDSLVLYNLGNKYKDLPENVPISEEDGNKWQKAEDRSLISAIEYGSFRGRAGEWKNGQWSATTSKEYKKPVQPIKVVDKPIKMDMRGISNSNEEPQLMPQRQQPQIAETQYKTELDTSNGSYHVKRYKDNTGKVVKEEYYTPDGKKLNNIVEQYAKGGKVKGYAYGGSPTFNNNIQGAGTAANTPQPTPTNGINKQQSLATGLVAANVGLNKLNGPQDTNMQYGTNDYFNNMNKTQAIQSGIANTASMLPGTAGIIGQGLKLQENVANIVDKKDAYGVSSGNQFQQTLGSYLRPGQAIGSIANDFKTGNVTGKTLAKAFLGGGILMNDENKVERAKLKYQSETDQNANQFKQDSAQQRASQESRVQDAIAAQNAGIENYQDSTYIPQAKLKQATMDDVQLSGYTKGWNNFNKKFANGGQVTGKGTAKSDSITAKVEEGSFIVPAINSKKAIELREMYLGGNPDKKADLKSGEVDVKLSNGESLFTPDEVNILTKAGIDLNKLAPLAKSKLGYGRG